MLKKNATIASWILQVLAAAILLQTLFFKFTGAPESIAIFSTLGAEPLGRIGSGIFELIASILLLYRRTPVFGAVLGMGVMAGAIGSHLTVLGITLDKAGINDGGTLFTLAVIVFVSCAAVLFIRRDEVKTMLSRVMGGRAAS